MDWYWSLEPPEFLGRFSDERELLERYEEFRKANTDRLVANPVDFELSHFDLDRKTDFDELRRLVGEGRKFEKLAVIHTSDPENLADLDEHTRTFLRANCFVLNA